MDFWKAFCAGHAYRVRNMSLYLRDVNRNVSRFDRVWTLAKPRGWSWSQTSWVRVCRSEVDGHVPCRVHGGGAR